jgi:hypothetical protein
VILYLETSALLRSAIQGQEQVAARMEQIQSWVTSALTLIECERSLIAMGHRKTLTRRDAAKALAYLREVIWRTEVSDLDGSLFERVVQPFPAEPVRTLDGLHLAAILRWAELGPLEVLTCDHRVKVNAEAFGLPVSYFPEEPKR